MGSYANIPNSVRKEVYSRDGYGCCLCSSSRYLQIHHYCPRGQGGNDTPHNLVTLCATCHAQAHGLIPFEDPDFTVADLEQAACEYLQDYYGPDWWPYK